jgi:hypothetical protein
METLLKNKKEVQRKINLCVREIVNILSSHYTFNKIKDIFVYVDSTAFIENRENLKIELYFDFKDNCDKNDIEFFMTRISSRVNDVRTDLMRNNGIFVTHVNSLDCIEYNKKQIDSLLTTTNFRKIIRQDKLNELLDE